MPPVVLPPPHNGDFWDSPYPSTHRANTSTFWCIINFSHLRNVNITTLTLYTKPTHLLNMRQTMTEKDTHARGKVFIVQ
jgi:hypothetical protein